MKLCFKNEQIVKSRKEIKVIVFSLQKDRKYGTIGISLNENRFEFLVIFRTKYCFLF